MTLKLFEFEYEGRTLEFWDDKDSATCLFVCHEVFGIDGYGLTKIELSPDDVVLDVGANVGIFATAVHRRFGCKVICFEPVPQNFECLQRNIRLNGCDPDAFTLVNAAVTDREGESMPMRWTPWATGNSSAFKTDGIEITVPTVSLRRWIRPEVKYIKVDGEGCEFQVLPDILDMLSGVKYMGLETHTFDPSHDQAALRGLLKDTFQGKVFG